MNKTLAFNRTLYTVSITYHELHCAVYISQYVCILYTNVTLATHYNEIHVAKQPHIIFLSCDFFIDTSRNPSKREERQTLPFCQSSTDGERHPGLSSMDSLMGTIMGHVLIQYATYSGKTCLLTLLPQKKNKTMKANFKTSSKENHLIHYKSEYRPLQNQLWDISVPTMNNS